ncbi:hypothetical protein PFICI_13477 [Pestalotiopsis fici W106-1]|uniref:RNase H type-1 domain-containing protein n=1 Tax=Pestalotiopsis fici (strain W106-1 / CGMCC3.15140) TaxID=1229662 RepID=W3WM94_PESFW|nr:uncharacterized protein PFICI_13477 [Pestalotiopsis fici W106-1]ETS74993.1 hypothetical protein PFICI_13477 [Pestalotiopsis fici W106-1]
MPIDGSQQTSKSSNRLSEQLASLTIAGLVNAEIKVQRPVEDAETQNEEPKKELCSQRPPSPTHPLPSEEARDGVYLNKYALRRQKREWLRDQLVSARASGELHTTLESRGRDHENSCWVCARRGQFQICPQVSLPGANPRVIIEDHLEATFFAAEAGNPSWRPGQRRLVFYTDMAAISGSGNDPSIAGAGVTYKRILGDDVSDWIDSSYGIVGTNRPDKSELYAVGLALEIAATEVEEICKDSPPTPIMVMTDSHAAMYYIHDYIWKGTIPSMFSRDTFDRLMLPITRMQELNVPLDFHWVPSHTSVEGNCRADALAGAASQWTLSRFPAMAYQTRFECQIVQIPDPKKLAYISVLGTQPPQKESRPKGQSYMSAKREAYADFASQIQGMQAQWVSDQLAESYRPSES